MIVVFPDHTHLPVSFSIFIGKHYIDVFWNDFPLDKSPFVGFAVPYKDEPEIIDTVVHVKHVPQVEVRKDPVMVERGPSNRHSEPPGGYWIRADRKPRHVDNGPQKVYILAPGKSEPSLDDVSCYTSFGNMICMLVAVIRSNVYLFVAN